MAGTPGRTAPAKWVKIFPQGSQALDTTNKPWGRDEFDLDTVIEFTWFNGTPLELLNLLRDELLASDEFSARLIPLKRGWRLDYPGKFHIDLIPARTDHDHFSTHSSAILAPSVAHLFNPFVLNDFCHLIQGRTMRD